MKQYRLSRNRVYRQINDFRWERGEVVISKAWMLQRHRAGLTPQQMADEAFCARCTIIRKMHQYDIPVAKRGNPQFRGLHNSDCMRVSENTEDNPI